MFVLDMCVYRKKRGIPSFMLLGLLLWPEDSEKDYHEHEFSSYQNEMPKLAVSHNEHFVRAGETKEIKITEHALPNFVKNIGMRQDRRNAMTTIVHHSFGYPDDVDGARKFAFTRSSNSSRVAVMLGKRPLCDDMVRNSLTKTGYPKESHVTSEPKKMAVE